MTNDNPRLRTDIQVTRGQAQGKAVMIIQDPTGIIPDPIALNTEFAAVLAMLDGWKDLTEKYNCTNI
jgi:hypothetical protein